MSVFALPASRRPTHIRPLPQRQARGISLITSLILLLLTSLLAVAGMRSVAVQTQMANSANNRGLAFQAAEAALRDTERAVVAMDSANIPNTGCSSGICAAPEAASAARWMSSNFTGWRNTSATVPADAPLPGTIAEDMGEAPNWAGCESQMPRLPNCMTRRFRITARSQDAGRVSVILQSHAAAQ